jgi:hypothetical protein
MKDLWHFHIPKTSGRALKENVLDILENDMHEHLNIKYNEHDSFLKLDDNSIRSILTLRNPVERTISHWLYFYKGGRRIDPELEKKEIIEYLLDNPNSCLINYQSKFISTELNNYGIEKDVFGYEPDLELVKKRLNNVTYLLDSKNQNPDLYKNVLNDIRLNFGHLENKDYVFRDTHRYKNKHSENVFASLTKKEINVLENIMNIDMDIYCSSSFFML